MHDLKLTTVGAYCGVLTFVSFLVGIVFMAISGVQVLIPETGGHQTLDWIADVHRASGLFFVGAWLVILGGIFALVAILGFYEALRGAGPVMILAPVLAVVGMTLVTVSHLIPIALAYELVPRYTDASGAAQASIGVTADTFASFAHVANYVGDALLWGVVVPLLALAILTTRAIPRWIGWLGLVTGALAGWLGLLSPASSFIDDVTFVGFIGFFVFMASFGVAVLRQERVRS
jgi:hypothetical protein